MIAVLVAFCLKLLLAIATYGTNDVFTWEAFDRKLHTSGAQTLYREGAESAWQMDGKTYTRPQVFNHPPLVLRLLQLWHLAEQVTGVPLRMWLRVTAALADAIMFCLIWGTLRAGNMIVRPKVLVAVALSPVSLLVSGFHGNTDPIMMCLLTLSIYLIVSGRPLWLAGVAMGCATNIKAVPLIFAPAVVMWLPDGRKRLIYVASASAAFVLGGLPIVVRNPMLVIRSIVSYTPIPNIWGLPEIGTLVLGAHVLPLLPELKVLALAAVVVASYWVATRAPSSPLLFRCGLVAALFLFLTPGFGTQYLAWLVPWMVALPWRTIRLSYGATAAFLVGYYGEYSHWHWYVAITFIGGPSRFTKLVLSPIAWVTVGLMAWQYFRASEGRIAP